MSGGSTGAALAASLFTFKRARGVHRPALAIMVPVPGAPFCSWTRARMSRSGPSTWSSSRTGAAFSGAVGGVASPRVAPLSNGTEALEGHRAVVAAHGVLSGSTGLNFVGNVEGFAIATGAADVIVADGFTGNVALKVMEGSSSALLGAVRSAALSSRRAEARGPAPAAFFAQAAG